MQYKNLAASAEATIGKALYNKAFDPIDAAYAKMIKDWLRDAAKFTIPEQGRIFDDELKGLAGESLHLPFPVVVLEFDTIEIFEGAEVTSNNVVIAVQGTAGYFYDTFKENVELFARGFNKADEDCIFVVAMNRYPHTKYGKGDWFAPYMASIINTRWDGEIQYMDGTGTPYVNTDPDKIMVKSHVMFALPMYAEKVCKNGIQQGISAKAFIDEVTHAMSYAITSVMEFCEATSCSNVLIDTVHQVDSKTANSRAKKGKLPLYEYKTLYLDLPNESTKSTPQGGTHSSPRQHLRRGHVRRLASGKKIWVQPCVVGAASNGVIDKAYAIRGGKK